MKKFSRGAISGAVLIGAAALLLLVAAFSWRGGITSATLVLVGVGSFLGGVFVLTLYLDESGLPEIVGSVAVDPVIDLARLCADLGLQGDAHLLQRDGQIVQIVPVGDLPPTELPPDDYSFISERYGGGVQLLPTGRSLYDRLVSEYGLIVPDDVEGICTAIHEVGEYALGLAEKVEVVSEGELIVVKLSGYRLFDGCKAIRATSPKCCTMIGCPTCSLFACMTVAGLGRPCKIEHVSIAEKERSVRLLLRPLPEPMLS